MKVNSKYFFAFRLFTNNLILNCVVLKVREAQLHLTQLHSIHYFYDYRLLEWAGDQIYLINMNITF